MNNSAETIWVASSPRLYECRFMRQDSVSQLRPPGHLVTAWRFAVWVSDCERQGTEPIGQLPHTYDNICLYHVAKRRLLDESKALDEQELYDNEVVVLLKADEAEVELQVSLIQHTPNFPERIL
jgi:hypothetical protein